ncbi:hypothetical protein [Pseudoxanthomonas sp. UTMC 1351]|uniref:hypothetical protein n=1 Tax=Pseudoxanthomonas sp. UTMC 1351 TaxID=2695853 RepID=UPI0034CFA71C
MSSADAKDHTIFVPTQTAMQSDAGAPTTTSARNLESVRNYVDSTSTDRVSILAELMRLGRPTPVTPAYDAPGMHEVLSTVGEGGEHNGYLLVRPSDQSGAFVYGVRVNAREMVETGDKFHISIEASQLEVAFAELSVLLFSDDCPFDQWKLADPSVTGDQGRVGAGAQITLYADQVLTSVDATVASQAAQIKDFISQIEGRLSNAGVRAGIVPESDVRYLKWSYCSYRNDRHSDRDGVQASLNLFEPLFQLMGDSNIVK